MEQIRHLNGQVWFFLRLFRESDVLRLWNRRIAVSLFVIALMFLVHETYLTNQPWAFFSSLSILIAIPGVSLRYEPLRIANIGWMFWQRCVAAFLMLCVIETGYRLVELFSVHETQAGVVSAETPLKVITFAEAQGDPSAFDKWWNIYFSEWKRNAELIQDFTPGGPVPYVFKPNTSRPFLHGTIRINSQGLSDHEVPLDKNGKFRIVTMGSSHTQCPPIEAGDTPWPAKLEQLIHDRVFEGREIEVLNAGAAAYTIEHNLHRLKTVVLPLKPDMIITYFGYNEFDYFRKEFPMPKMCPNPRPKASKLIGKLDARFATWLSEHTPTPPLPKDLTSLEPKLASCRLAHAYREFVEIARREQIKLVVCNFNMAVDEHSPDEVIHFYEQAFPNTRYMIQANRLHSALLPLVVTPESEAKLIDVQAGLNGHWDHEYVDLVHLSERGKVQLAENVFQGIADLLPVGNSHDSQDISPPLVIRPVQRLRL